MYPGECWNYDDYDDLRTNPPNKTHTRDEYVVYGEYLDPIFEDSSCSNFFKNFSGLVTSVMNCVMNGVEKMYKSYQSFKEWVLTYSTTS